MERDIFIISVYCLVVEIMQNIETGYNLRQKGFPPKLTDAEVITIEICGEFFKLHEDTELYNYFKRHYLHFFPNLPSRTTFVRQSARLVASQSFVSINFSFKSRAKNGCGAVN